MKKNIFKNDKTFIFPFWIMMFFIIWLQVIPQTKSLLEATLFTIFTLTCSYPFSTYLSGTLLQKAMKEKNVVTFLWQFILFSILVGSIFSAFLYLFSFLEKKGFFPPSTYFDMNVPNYYMFVFISSGIALNLCICGIRFFQENIKLKKTLLEYQLQTLQHQVTPHFMFNILNHIHVLMQANVETASFLLLKYSEILRYQLYNGNRQVVTLEQDIQFLKDFIAIEEMRLGDKVTVNCTWKIESGKREIPPLLFITFIENAFKHVSKSDFERGYITIYFEQKESTLLLDVLNSKSQLPDKKTQKKER